jgi:hypothetical protein
LMIRSVLWSLTVVRNNVGSHAIHIGAPLGVAKVWLQMLNQSQECRLSADDNEPDCLPVGLTIISHRCRTLSTNGQQPPVEPTNDVFLLRSNVEPTAPLVTRFVIERVETALGISVTRSKSGGALRIANNPFGNSVCVRQKESKGRIQSANKCVLSSPVGSTYIRIAIGLEQ